MKVRSIWGSLVSRIEPFGAIRLRSVNYELLSEMVRKFDAFASGFGGRVVVAMLFDGYDDDLC
jgi:hypothetical protein